MYCREQFSLPLTSIQSWGFSFFAKVQYCSLDSGVTMVFTGQSRCVIKPTFSHFEGDNYRQQKARKKSVEGKLF